jgi:hypothetical protein
MGKQVRSLAVLLLFLGLNLTACDAPDPEIGCIAAELISAINAANNNPDHTTIIMEEDCLINLTVVDNEMNFEEILYANSGVNGLPPISTPITIEGHGSTIQRLNSAPEMRFFFITSTGELTLDNITLNNGLVQSAWYFYNNGGAIANKGVLNLVQSHVLESYAEYYGGGIYNMAGGTVYLDSSSISFNQAGDSGGALANQGTMVIDGFSILNHNQALGGAGGAIFSEGDLTIHDSHVSFNQAGHSGGGISAYIDTMTSLDGVLFEGNQAGSNGGGAVTFRNTDFTVQNCAFLQNQASGTYGSGGAINIFNSDGNIGAGTTFVENTSSSHGGGVYIDGSSSVIIDSATFQDNTASQGGGGLASHAYEATVQITDSSFIGSSAAFGGGIANLDAERFNSGLMTVEKSLISENTSGIYNAGELLTLINSTVSGNHNQAAGGGIVNYTGTMEIMFSTIAFNQATGGAGLAINSGAVTIKNSIVSSNTPTNCALNGGSLTALEDNLDNDGSCQGFTLTANPYLKGLVANGGPTMTHAFLFDSPAVDGATNCPDITGSAEVNHDQRGEPRPFNTYCDLGAYEAQSIPSAFQAIIQAKVEELVCLEGPHENFNQVTSFFSGDSLTALGGNEDGSWLGVAGTNGQADEVACWVPSDGVESPLEISQYPILLSPLHPPDPCCEADEQTPAEESSRCELFAPETYSLFLLGIPYGTGDLTLYLHMPEGVHGLEIDYPEDPEPCIYSAVLGSYEAPECTFDGYAGRLYCRFEIPERYFGTVRELNMYVNSCVDPFYTHNQVTIVEPVEPLSCAPTLSDAECKAAGGSYSCGVSADCTCICP